MARSQTSPRGSDAAPFSDAAMLAWRRFLRSHCAITRQLDGELATGHGLTLSDYDVLVQLRDAEGGRLKMSQLAQHVLLTRSGITRLIDGLVREGYVERTSCDADGRVSYAMLTDQGRSELDRARRAHLAGIARAFADRFTEDEAETLAELLGRLPGGEIGASDDDTGCPGTSPERGC